ncbi:two-component regulator propeller domain-containing protein [uncultured Clostridium sp.]|uniref:ligand-binding sensor domain-containing protein n=1 Tax=uncultured Clostridium sp. TaxID=59620 RepID=UPI0028E4C888|nr:two-component regulator propeller domain-containing protein [uncultured Clostridium sp.]
MNILLKKIGALLVIILICNTLFTNCYNNVQASVVNFKSITIEDGLPQSSVETIFQDSKGYIWIGTQNGLSKYNGKNFKTYRYKDDSIDSIANNVILAIKEDTKENLWVGTSNGLSKINLNTYEIKNYYEDKEKGNLSNYNICDILITKDGNVLVATADGLNVYDEHEDKFERILYDDNKQILSNQVIYSLDEDEEGNLWIGTECGLNKIDINKKEVIQLYNEENTIEKSIYKVYADNHGYVWVGTFGAGLLKVSTETNKITEYTVDESKTNALQGGFIKDILRDSNGVTWICTDEGLAKYDEKNNEFITYLNKIYDKYSLTDNNTFSIIEDRTGLMWVGTYSGISTFDPNNNIRHYKKNPSEKNSLSSNSIQGIYEDDEELLWIGTDKDGVNILNTKINFVNHLNTDNSNLISDKINFITGRGNDIWIATDNGLSKFDKNTKKIKSFTVSDGLSHNKIVSLLIDNKDYLWIGTADGINVLNTKTYEITNLTDIFKKNGVIDTYFYSIFQDSAGMCWIGSYIEGGLIKINPENNYIKIYKKDENNKNTLSSNSIISITEDKNNNLWVGTNYGINKFNKKSEKFTRYTEKNGLANNTIYGILIDKNNNPWVSTNYGISKLDINTNTFFNLNTSNGLQSNEFNGNSYFKNNKGEFIFGGINGINIFDSKEISEKAYSEYAIFDEFEVKGKEYNDINDMKFDWYENMIKAKIFVPDFRNTNNTKYYYKLSSVDSDWIVSNENEFVYNNLKPGKHILKVKVMNGYGDISKENQVKFIIKPPLWKSSEAIFMYFFMILLIIYLSITKLKNLDRMVEKRTKQLKDEMEKNIKLFDKVIDLERRKNNYFVNLSHELRTPLNVISSTEQLISELNKQDDGIDKEKLSYYMKIIKRNSNRLLKLINNIIDTNKIESGRYEINLKENDIVYLVEETSLSLKDYIENKGIHLIIDPEMEEKIIMCDSYEIERCIVNLVSNAAKFTPEGGEIKVTLKELNNKVIITVKDTGIGIDPKYHKAVFDRFNQIIDANSESKGGSGLGLTITKHIIDLHKGKIYVNSDIGKGCEFVIILPTNIM